MIMGLLDRFNKKERARAVVLGLDGVPHSLLENLKKRGRIPYMASIFKNGYFGRMSVCIPEISSVSWSSFMTGAQSGVHGIYGFMDLEPGTYTLRAFTSTGVELTDHDLEGADEIKPDQDNERDLPVDPSGRVYDATNAKLLPGTVVSIYYDDEDSLSPGQKVPLDRLPRPSQQDQVTDQYGLYAFDLESGHKYKLAIAPPSPSWIFP